MRRAFQIMVLAALCFVGWLMVARDFSPWSLVGAAALALAAAGFAAPVFFEENPLEAVHPVYRADLLVLVFLTWLVEGYIASLEIIARMLTGRYRSGVVRVPTRLRSRLGRVLLANMITLVPGTLSLWLRDRHIFVHWFDVKSEHSVHAGDLIKRRMEAYLERIFG